MFKHKLNSFLEVREYFRGETKNEHGGFNQNLFRKVILVMGLTIFAIWSVLGVNFSCPILPFSPKNAQFNYFQSK